MLAKFALVSCFAALSSIALAQDDTSDDIEFSDSIYTTVDTPFVFTECAAPEEMKTCWESQPVDEYDDWDETCLKLEKRTACALTNCWNRVYSCDYQRLAVQYNITCSGDDFAPPKIPFFPAPGGAEAACTCSLNDAVKALDVQSQAYLNCSITMQHEREQAAVKENPDVDLDDLADGESYPECSCCFYGGISATFEDSCPETDPAPLGLATFNETYFDKNNTLATCPTLLSKFSCADFNFHDKAQELAKPATAGPTGSLTDLPGIMTSPVSGATYTWTAINATYTITAASVEAMATRSASVTGSATGSAKGKKTGTATGTASGASSTSSGSAGIRLSAEQRSMVAFAGFAGLAVVLL